MEDVCYGPPEYFDDIIQKEVQEEIMDSSTEITISNDKKLFLITTRIEWLMAMERKDDQQISYYEEKFNEIANIWFSLPIVDEVKNETSIEKLEQLK